MSSDILGEIEQLLKENRVVNRMSLFQMKHFLIGKEPTIQAKLRCCLNELSARKHSLRNLVLAIEDTNDDIRLLELNIEERSVLAENTLNKVEKWDIETRKLNRKKVKLELTLEDLLKTQRETEEEANFFLQAFKKLQEIEPLKPFDDLQTNLELWNEKYSDEIHLRLLTGRPLDLNLVKCILNLDKETPIRKELVSMLEQIEKQAIEEKKRRALVADDHSR